MTFHRFHETLAFLTIILVIALQSGVRSEPKVDYFGY